MATSRRADLVNLPPLARLLFHETAIDGRHDLVELLKVVGSLCDLLHQGGARAPV